MRAAEIAEKEHASNVALHRGVTRWGLVNDAVFDLARSLHIPVSRVPAGNNQTHTEVVLGDVVLTVAKGDTPGVVPEARYRTLLSERHNGQTEMFGPAKPVRRLSTYAILQHTASTDGSKPSDLLFVVPDPFSPDVPIFEAVSRLHASAAKSADVVEIEDRIGRPAVREVRRPAAK